jgi:hypothetical protein
MLDKDSFDCQTDTGNNDEIQKKARVNAHFPHDPPFSFDPEKEVSRDTVPHFLFSSIVLYNPNAVMSGEDVI